MKTKDELLEFLRDSYYTSSLLAERQLMSLNVCLEVLIDIRDLLKDLDSEIQKLNAKW